MLLQLTLKRQQLPLQEKADAAGVAIQEDSCITRARQGV